ncbi:hypothetical protein OJ997_12470 [Solirubrobacter phytolaccae]|uniref:Uncharacterized protein n=1 Tax=Solirubrobacter phytolaccae TaxID=1404360 RepID=A0A9X3SF80_9ACTN|nr:hypothetical protein [Solirubrobacter phytolaccae]MDA0181112.1 hypothetical protein [Solirubrobacter phytolaccae]
MLRLLPLCLIALLVLAAPANAAASKCPRGTVVIGSKKHPRACLPKTLPAKSPALLKPFAGKVDRKLEQLAMRELRARAARAGDLPPGVEMTIDGSVIELRRESGASVSMGLETASTVPQCPRADGNVPATLDETLVFGTATADHGKRTWKLVTMRSEATWTGHVGVGAKAETFDVAFRGELSIKSGVEIAATGKALKRNPTRTYRSALSKKGVPVGFDPIALARELTFRGPKGLRASEQDIEVATGLFKTSMLGLMEIPDALADGDKRWYDERACAVLDFTWSPEKVVKGGRADWNAWVNAQDGTRATDARWTLTSGCGAFSAASLSGATVSFGVADSAGAWVPNSDGACAKGEITSTAGRPRPFDHHVFPVDAKRWRYDIKIEFLKDMGPEIVPTKATGTGSVTVGPGEGVVEGSGAFSGTEWASGADNTCGDDMTRQRAFSSAVAVGAEIQGEEVTIGFTAIERPFDAAWIVTVPVTGGEQTFKTKQPFCGEPEKAVRTAIVRIAATPAS